MLNLVNTVAAVSINILCGPTNELLPTLQNDFNEDIVWGGELVDEGGVASFTTLHVNESTGTWSVVLNRADGTSCLVLDGIRQADFRPAPGQPT